MAITQQRAEQAQRDIDILATEIAATRNSRTRKHLIQKRAGSLALLTKYNKQSAGTAVTNKLNKKAELQFETCTLVAPGESAPQTPTGVVHAPYRLPEIIREKELVTVSRYEEPNLYNGNTFFRVKWAKRSR